MADILGHYASHVDESKLLSALKLKTTVEECDVRLASPFTMVPASKDSFAVRVIEDRKDLQVALLGLVKDFTDVENGMVMLLQAFGTVLEQMLASPTRDQSMSDQIRNFRALLNEAMEEYKSKKEALPWTEIVSS
jgi:hypothetical protein